MPYPNQNYLYPQQYQTPMYNQQMNAAQIAATQPQPLPQQTMQSGGFMLVPSEQVARNYPVAPGNVITFKIENQPYVCEKAQGFSQLEGPVFNKYRLVKEDEQEEIVVETTTNVTDDLKNDIAQLKEDVKALKERLYSKPKTLNKPNENKGGHRNE